MHHATLIGYFLGSRLHFPVVQNYVKSAWSKFGYVDSMMNNNGVYFFKFNDAGGCAQVIESGPLMIRGVPLFVSLWDPMKGINKPVHDTCPLWIKLHNISLIAFNREGIGRIASALGVPKQMDACTSSMCDKAWGRPGFAKVLVDVWAVGELKRELEVVIPSLTGGDDMKVKIGVEYIWEPSQCTHCLVFGHKASGCAKAIQADNKKQKAQVVDEDGFVRVERRKWRPKQISSGSDVEASMSGVDKEGRSVEECSDGHIDNLVKEKPGEECSDDHVENIIIEKPVEVLGEASDMVQPNVVEVAEDVVIEPVKKITPSPNEPPAVVPSRTNSGSSDIPGGHLRSQISAGDQSGRNVITKPVRGILKNPGKSVTIVTDDGRSKDVGAKLVNKQKEGEVRKVLIENGVSFCALVETHLRADMLGNICNQVFGSWKWISNTNVSPNGTRIILAWDDCVGDVMMLECHAQFIHCFVRLRGGTGSFFLTIVYGSNSCVERRELWSGLRKAKVLMGTQPWTIMGDFNSMLFPHDGFGGTSRRNASMEEFFSCVEDIEVLDVNYSGIQYTWVQKPNGGDGIVRKLDRIMANLEFLDVFTHSSVVFKPQGLSDHAVGVLEINVVKTPKKRGFKFDNFVVDHHDFLPVVLNEWRRPVFGSFMHKLLTHLKHLKQPLRKLHGRYGDMSKRVDDLHSTLNVIQLAVDLNPLDRMIKEELSQVRMDYQQARLDEESYYRQRAKIRWLSEGDSNTKFFHNAVKEKRNRNYIRSILDAHGTLVRDDDVPNVFLDHFRSFLGMRDPLVQPVVEQDMFYNPLSLGEPLDIIRPITDGEIKEALFGIGNDKAPGSDGFSSKFFKSAWSVIGNDLMVAVHNFFYTGRILKEINHTLLCFIPKIPNATRVADFRPISCCSVLYKVISKVIAERMKPYLAQLVGPTQSAFIPGRRIADNIMMAHELVVGYQRQQGQPRCAFKIDLRKAYDTVDWRYLACILSGLGFHTVFCKWIDELLNTSSFSIVLNGETHGFFKGARGLRQGDPISPYLFTIVMEDFSRLLKKCIDEAVGFGYHEGCADLHITHLCFADDLFVFTRGDLASVEILKKVLDLFRVASGLEPNLSKSEVFFCNVRPEDRNVILNYLPLQTGMFPIRYLGIPLSPVCLRVADFAPLVNKVKARIHDWKAKFLSFCGSETTDYLRLFRSFLWGQGDDARGRCKISWDVVCQPIQSGGLGIRRLSTWNRALVSKHIWDILSNRNSLWVSWIRTSRLQGASFWTIRSRGYWPWIFRKILDLRESMRMLFRFIVGNGDSINAWVDTWFSGGPLSMLISYRRFHNTGFGLETTARDLITQCNGVWSPTWVELNPAQFADPPPTVVHGAADTIKLVQGSNLIDFMVKDAWKAIVGPSQPLAWTKYMCGPDSHDHLFFMCPFSVDVWRRVKSEVGLHGFPERWSNIMILLEENRGPKKKLQKLALAGTVYFIWMERNRRLFKNLGVVPIQLFKQIREVIWTRIAWRKVVLKAR
ncbi:hypothetical protein OSB04_023710 [Centaurea solstitialis]|uniref:Reverse transcriptase domain-containing protein n=1 Tax=Centaurea solstitialis TaxID=347529 RepID=A0AA38SKE4_9ASTR|nr:hypothetical protein OSB04_023710 [Centaurea solstitialis]